MIKRPEDVLARYFRGTVSGVVAATAAVVLLIGSGASAAPQGPPGGQFGGPGGPGGPPPRREMTAAQVPVEALSAALKLTAAQRTKIQAIQQRNRPQWGGRREEGGLPPPPAGGSGNGWGGGPDREQRQAQEKKAAQEIAAVLTPEQRRALPALLKEIDTLRTVGIPAGTYASLKLTAAQKTRLSAIAKQSRPSPQPGGGGMDWEAMEKKRSQTRAAALAVLTAAQKKTVDAYVRAHPRTGPGGFGGPGGFPGGMPRGGEKG